MRGGAPRRPGRANTAVPASPAPTGAPTPELRIRFGFGSGVGGEPLEERRRSSRGGRRARGELGPQFLFATEHLGAPARERVAETVAGTDRGLALPNGRPRRRERPAGAARQPGSRCGAPCAPSIARSRHRSPHRRPARTSDAASSSACRSGQPAEARRLAAARRRRPVAAPARTARTFTTGLAKARYASREAESTVA